MDNTNPNYLKGVIEALLFVSEKPVTMDQMKEVLEGIDPKAIRDTVENLKAQYDQVQGGMVIVEIAGGYQMLSNSAYAESIRLFFRTQKKEKLSKPALETLAIVAYKQPVTRLEVEMIRGVNSDGVVNHLLEKGLIKIAGRKDVPGKPYEYGTTKQFLEYFGLRSLADLPKIEEFLTMEDGSQKIAAFQGISEEFKQQTQEYSPLANGANGAGTGDATNSPEGQGATPAEGETPRLEAEPQGSSTITEGGQDEHPQTA